MARYFLQCAVALAFLAFSHEQGNENPCSPFQTCAECIVGGGGCAWCRDEDWKAIQRSRARCDLYTNINATCKNITNPSSKTAIPSGGNEPLSSTVQVTPQQLDLTLRPGQPSKFRVKIRPAEDYPADLYYLMDLSYSMKDDLDNLKNLGQRIANTISSITKNFRLGFGSFVDKTVSPYVQVERAYPCSPCRKTFGFEHNLNFTKDAKMFEDGVKRQTISGNLDQPEGGFDALMQVAVCESRIGWQPKDKARRLVVFVTDASFHMAGDGKLGGIVTPNDGVCHLDSKQLYSKSNTLDYPSVGYLKKKLKESKIVPILAVTNNVQTVYLNLAREWKDLGATSGVLAGDSRNIVDLIKDAYNKITSTVRLVDNSLDVLKVDYKTIKCRQGTGSECTSVAIKEEVEFEVSVTALACTPELKKLKSFQISIAGFGDITVKTSVICDCDCEKSPPAVANSTKCNGNGTYACGSCYCNKGRFGDTCKCDSAAAADDSLCRFGNDTSSPVCSGLGTCICGKCECLKRKNPAELITGTYCQCTNFGCERSDSKPCGGPDHGKCVCGKCICEGIWTGTNCGKKDCEKLNHNCVKNEVVCGGKGKCDCGRCNCDTGYKGDHCESCPTCPGQCSKNRDCVLCKVFKIGNMTACDECTLNVKVVNTTIPNAKCLFQDEEGCNIVFDYGEDEFGNFTATVRQTKVCPVKVIEKPNILAIVLGTVGGIVLAGLVALLIWKLMVSAYDKYEYHRFEKERSASKWQKAENPLYKQAKQKYDNPVYAGQR